MGCSPSYNRLNVVEAEQRVSLSASALRHPLIVKCKSHSVSQEELKLTMKMFRDLASRSGGATIDKTTFLQFFPLPVRPTQGLWGERLFDKFDRKQTGHIDFEEFAMGLSQCIKSSRDEKLRFLFSLYDLKGDGLIDKAEFLTMVRTMQVHNTYKVTLRKKPENEVTIEPSEVRKRNSLFETPASKQRGSAAMIHRDESQLPENIQQLVTNIMDELHAGEKLDYSQFVRFVDQHPRIMDVFTDTFHQDIWTSRTFDRSYVHSNRTQSLCLPCLNRRRRPEASTSKVPASLPTISLSDSKTGWLMLKTPHEGVKKVYAVLRSDMLLLYPTPATPIASNILFLGGCYIDPLEEFTQGNEHGFSVTHQFEGFPPMSFWTGAKQDRDSWVVRLQMAAKARRVEDFYEIKERIGSGKFSDVYTAVERITDFRWAIKVIEKKRLNEAERELLRSEIAIMKLLNHPNVVEMKEVFEDKHKMYVVLELVEGGELFERIRKKRVFTEYMAYNITKQLIETVKYLHEVGIVHRDIKPENILLSDDSELPMIKLADFGLSKLVGPSDTLNVPCGTLGYVAPEVLMMRPYGKTVDLWSIGVVCYLMVRGRLPFDSKDKQTLINKTIEASLDLTGQYWSRLTHFGKDFLEKLLTKEPEERLTCEQALNHSWLKNGEVLIPRKINRKLIVEDLMRNTLTNSKIPQSIYDEHPKSSTMDPDVSQDYRVIYSTPDVYEDMEVERKTAEHRIQI